MDELLKIDNLSICYKEGDEEFKAVNNLCFSLNKGECVGIIGESGSGKTSIAMAIMSLLNKEAKVNGSIFYKNIELLSLSEENKNKYRWDKIAIVFQNTVEVLNPVLTIQEQIIESVYEHCNDSKAEAKLRVKELLNLVELDEKWAYVYPHELSGGMRQRVLIAMALACNPEFLIVDEPTTALDPIGKEEIVKLLKKLQIEKNLTMLVISHELPVILSLTSKIKIMYKGSIVEEGITKEVIKNPMHTYSRGLIHSSVEVNPFGDLWGIPYDSTYKFQQGCEFYFRCVQRTDECRLKKPKLKTVFKDRKVACNRGGIITLLKAKNIKKIYNSRGMKVEALKGCDIEVRCGEIVSLIGQSGSGKTTLASIIAGILNKDSGEVFFQGNRVQGNSTTSKKGGIQMVFQDPFSSINSCFTVEQAVSEPLDIIKEESKEERLEKVIKILEKVQLPVDNIFLNKKCSNLSGGQRQRVAIARSLIMEPKLLIADEISSMLDPSTKANVLRILKGLQNSNGFAMLYITHDISIAKKISDIVFVMYQGNIVEKGSVLDIFKAPKHPYTQKLIAV